MYSGSMKQCLTVNLTIILMPHVLTLYQLTLNLPTSSPPNSSDFFNMKKSIKTTLKWVVLCYVASVEAVVIILLTLPDLDALRKGLIIVAISLLKPFLPVVPVCLFLLANIYWKYELMPNYEFHNCLPSEHLRH